MAVISFFSFLMFLVEVIGFESFGIWIQFGV
jgi:hypothetical protein